MNNHGNYIVSLGDVCRWLGQQAEALGVEIYPGFAAAEVLYDEDGAVKGVATGDMGIGKDGKNKDSYTPGMELHAKYTLIAEGVRGSLAKHADGQVRPARRRRSAEVRHRHQGAVAGRSGQLQEGPGRAFAGLAADGDRQPGRLVHVPLRRQPGRRSASWCISTTRTRTSRRSTSSSASRRIPTSRKYLKGGKRLAYGSRAINEGGLQSIPKLTFPGGALIGCSAGFVNVPRIKGSHNAMKSGMLARRGGVRGAGRRQDRRRRADRLSGESCKQSWIWKDLDKVRNVKPALQAGARCWARSMAASTCGCTISASACRGRCTTSKADHETLRPASEFQPIQYPKPDGVITLRQALLGVPVEHQPRGGPAGLTSSCSDPSIPIAVNLPLYAEPAQRYCPAGVYEVVTRRQRPAALPDQRAELRALQDLRHQGSGAEHRLDGAGRRRRAQLPNM